MQSFLKQLVLVVAVASLTGCINSRQYHGGEVTKSRTRNGFDIVASFWEGMNMEAPKSADVRLAVFLDSPFHCVVRDALGREFILSGSLTMTAEKKFSFGMFHMKWAYPNGSSGALRGTRYDLRLGEPYSGGSIGGPSFRIVVVQSGDRNWANEELIALAGARVCGARLGGGVNACNRRCSEPGVSVAVGVGAPPGRRR